jgi:CDP-2,3-bis-(O-geranylgeranyl)-sn-glycerol synthase
MLNQIIQALYFFLPAYIANAVPVVMARYKLCEFLNVPVDFNGKIRGKPLIGPSKTWRGLIFGTIGAMLITFLQFCFYEAIPPGQKEFLYMFPYEFPAILYLGFLMGIGEGFGDTVKSFFKRRMNKKNSAPFFPFDQMSFLGALLLSFLYYIPSATHIWIIVIVSPLIPICANIIAYKIGWKKVWW